MVTRFNSYANDNTPTTASEAARGYTGAGIQQLPTHGETLRVQHIPAGLQMPQEATTGQGVDIGRDLPQSRVYDGAISYTVGSDAPQHSGSFARHSVSHDGVQGGSLVATLRNEGAARTVELEPGNPASRTRLEVALREGLVREVAPGRYEDAGSQQAPQQQQPAQQQAQEPQQAQHFASDEVSHFEQIIDPLPQHSYDRAVAALTVTAVNGTGTFEAAAQTLAESSGMEPAQALEVIQQGYAVHEAAVARSVAQMGITGDHKEAFYDFCQTKPRQMHEAVQKLTHMRDTSGFDVMAAEYLRHAGKVTR